MSYIHSIKRNGIWYNKDLPLIKIRKDDFPFRSNNPPHAYVPTVMCRRFDEYGPCSDAAVYKQSQTSAQPVAESSSSWVAVKFQSAQEFKLASYSQT